MVSYIYCSKGHILEHISGKNYFCSICDEKVTIDTSSNKDWYDAIALLTPKQFSARYGGEIYRWNEENKDFLKKVSEAMKKE